MASSALESSVRECGAGLCAIRANERKKNAENLKDFLSRNAVPSLLTENTIKKKGYGWNELFDDIHEFIIKETEKFETTKNFENVIAPLCTSLLHACVSGSNKGKSYIKCEKVINACLYFLKDIRLAKAIGDAYLSLLSKHVLNCEHYLGYITPASWADLLHICQSMCLASYCKLDDFTKMKLIWLIVKNATNYCQFTTVLRDSLPKMKSCFYGIEGAKKLQDIAIEIMILLLETLSAESRLTMCEFVEGLMTPILKFYDQNLDQKKKSSFFKLVHLIVTLHHPLGKAQKEDGSLAHNWTVWRKQILSIIEVICLEVAQLQKPRKVNDNLKHQEEFYTLAASVYYQIFNSTLETNVDEAGSSSKRQRHSMNRNKTFGDLIEELRHNHLPWLSIINIYIKKYSHSISKPDYMQLAKVLDDLLTNSKTVNWGALEQAACSVVQYLLPKADSVMEENDILVSLWNSCVRTCTIINSAQASHTIMQCLLTTDILKHQNVQPLIKLYYDKAMPVTDHSVMTLSYLFHKFYSHCSGIDKKLQYFHWLVNGNMTSVDVDYVRQLLLRLIANDNFPLTNKRTNVETDKLEEVVLESFEKSILFSVFELEAEKIQPEETNRHNILEKFEVSNEVNEEVMKYFQTTLKEHTEKLKRKEIDLPEYMKFTNVVLVYFDFVIKYNLISRDQIKNEQIYILLNNAYQLTYTSLTNTLKSDVVMTMKVNVLQYAQDLLKAEYDPSISAMLRACVNDTLFHSINNLLHMETNHDDNDYLYTEDDSEIDPKALRHNCICFMAAYCRKRQNYRSEILDLVLDPKIYNFNTSWDFACAVQCIELLISPEVEDPPLEAIFTLMQRMCKDLFRNSNASYKILKILMKILEQIWSQDNNMKQNCFIMVKGYMLRCEKSYYSPKVAALIYKCAAKLIELSQGRNQDIENSFTEILMQKMNSDIHSIRLYCCYMLKDLMIRLSDAELLLYLSNLTEIFTIEVTEGNESVLEDETSNRTLTILHSAFALVQAKNYLLYSIVNEIMQIQKKKKLDQNQTKKVLNKITNSVTKTSIEKHLNDNISSVLNFWYLKGNPVDQLPFYLFGFETMDEFMETHIKWLVAADVLWGTIGVISESDILKQIQDKSGKSAESILEMCLGNILVLCLPYLVTESYSLNYMAPGKIEWAEKAIKIFESSRQMLKGDKWSSAFAGNLSEFLNLLATHMKDHAGAGTFFNASIPLPNKSYQYPKIVFEATLKFLSELIKQDYMHYLCENRAFAVLRALFKIWQDVLQESIFEYKMLNLHTYMMLLETISLGYNCDAFVCSFACSSLAHAIKTSKNAKEIEAYAKTLKSILDRLLPEKVDLLRTSISKVLSILMIKKEEGFENECASLLNFLVRDIRDYLNEGEDVIDFVTSLSQGALENATCSTMFEFNEKLQTYRKSLTCPSHESLMKLREFLMNNKRFVINLCDEINPKGFSDDCGESVIHQVIHALCNITISASDEKTITEACNCLAEIGNYDLKTLVTVPPENTQRVINVHPKQYFAIIAKSSLAEVLFDGNPAITNGVAKALIRLLQYREGKTALDLEEFDKQILLPFASPNPVNCAEFTINNAKFKALLTSWLWVPNGEAKHGHWLIKITCAILDILLSTENYLNSLRAVCVAKPDLCRKILPPLVGLLLACSTEQHVKLLADQMTRFFNHIWEINFENRLQNSEDSNAPTTPLYSLEQDLKMIVQYMLDIVNFVRLQRHHYKPRSERTLESLNYLRLEYDKVAWAALVADQNLAAIYYGELWAMANNDGVPPSSPDALSQLIGGENMQRIFRRCFVSIGEMDAIDGCGTAHLTSEEEKRKHLINTGQFTDALLLHDIALSSGNQVDPQLQYGVVKSLHKSGMHHLALQYIKSLPENDDLDDIKYDCLSYLGDWSDFVNTSDLEEKSKQVNCNPHSIIKAFRYSCLKDCINLQTTKDYERKLIVPLNRAKLAVARLSQNLNMENCQSVYKILSKLHQFKDIEDYFSVRCDKLRLTDLLDQWQVENLPPYNDFKHLEALMSQRSLILEHAGKNYSEALKDIIGLQLQYAELGVSNHRVQIAQRLLAKVKKMHSSPEITLVESHISWAKGHKDIALSLLRQIVSHPSPDVRLTAMSLRQYGMWMAESKCDNARDIIDKYLKNSLEVLNANDDKETRLKVYYDIAKFADAEYKQIVTYMNSAIFEKKVKVLEDMKDTATVLRSTQQLSKDERKAMFTTNALGQIDEAEIASTRAEKESFLRLAMRYYLLSLKEDETNNLSIFRVISLWLDNPSIEFEDESFSLLLHSIPSRKFVTVLPQLTPRLSKEKTEFADNLTQILKRCAREHPHHTLPHIFSLRNSDKDKMILNASENIGGNSGKKKRASMSTVEPRVEAAEELIDVLAEDSDLTDIITQMDKLCDAIISIANFVPRSKDQNVKHKIPAAERIHRLGPLNAIPIPTATIPVSPICDYRYITSLHSFENYFELVGGINCPKKISCRGSDGISRILLIKGEDDLRQDAVMQQVFNIVNTLLEKNPVTKRNKLLIRTYKVVPMSRRSGVLEWCEGTMPIGGYLTGTRNAHARYRPQDISVSQARAMMTALGEQRKSNAEKFATFSRILREFKPVFHYFFTENFLDPVTWYERRLAYTKSVAASSMVGHILGLGDRHLQNILIDKRTAEVVHIDFGIAFDQGKALPTPETIPFRLTQDIVAAFGSSGVEGIFRKSCERTMQLLRDNQDTLLTILEVLLCDPLYSWMIISKQQNVLTRDTTGNHSSSEGSLAKRALLTVSSKLSGTEGGVAGGVSVSGQVARLIHTAMDAANLSRLYHGWQPYL